MKNQDTPSPKAPPRPRVPKRRRWRRRAFVLVAGISLFVALLWALESGWQRDRLLRVATNRIAERLGTDLSVGRARGHLREGLTLEEVRLGPADAPLLRIDSAALRWSAGSFFSDGPWRIESVRIRGLSGELRRTREGQWQPIPEVLERLAAINAKDVDAEQKAPSPQPVEIGEIAVEASRVAIELERERGIDVPADAPPEVARFSIDGDLLLSSAHFVLNAAEGETALTLGEGAALLRLSNLETGVPGLDEKASGQLRARTVGQTIEFAELSLDALGVQAEAEIKGDPRQAAALTLHVESEDLSPLGALGLLPSPLSGGFVSQAKLEGALNALKGELEIEASAFRMGDARAESLDLKLLVDQPFDPLALGDWASIATRSGEVPLRAHFHLRGRQVDPGALAADWILPGASDLDLRGRTDAGVLTLETGHVAHPQLALEATGNGSTDEIDALHIRFETADVAPWQALWAPATPMRGALSGSADLSGDPNKPTGRLELQSPRLSVSGQPLGALAFRARTEAAGPAPFELTLGEPDAPALRAKGQIDAARRRVDFAVNALAQTWLPVLFPDAPGLAGTESALEAAGFVQQSTEGLLFETQLRGEETRLRGQEIGQIDVSIQRTTASQLELPKIAVAGKTGSLVLGEPVAIPIEPDGAWRLDKASVAFVWLGEAPAAGTLILSATGQNAAPRSLNVVLDHVPVAVLNRFRPGQAPLAGRISGRAQWQTDRVPGWTEGELDWEAPALGEVRLDSATARWTGEREAIDLEIETRLDERAPLSVRGRFDVRPSPAGVASQDAALTPVQQIQNRLSLEATLLDWDLAALERFTPTWMRGLRGRLSGSARLAPSGDGPMLSGRTRIREGSFAVPLLRQRFEPITATLSLDRRSVHVDALQIGRDGADAQVFGRLRLPESGPPEFGGRIQFDHFPLARSSAAHLDVLGQIEVRGTTSAPSIKGEIEVSEARIGVPANDDPVLKEIRIATAGRSGELVEPGDDASGGLGAAEIEIGVRVPDSTRVRGQGANLFVEGDAKILKRPEETTRIVGEARVASGTYTFQGRAFEVRRGRVQLTGDERLDPLVDVEARLPVADILAIVELSGRLSAPIVRLRSDPPLPDQDVLSYLLFGRAAEEVAAAGNSRFGAAAARLVAGVAEKELRGVLGDAMPVDSIEIGADAEGNTSEVGFGKYLSPNLFFRYVHVLGDEPSDRVGVEYRVNDTLSVGSSVSTTGDAGLDLILRHDF